MGLLIQPAADSSATKIGGLPAASADFDWPACRSCQRAMQFIAQIRLSDSDDESMNSRPDMLLIFMCQNDPGMCDDWDADAGGNAAFVVAPGSASITPPASGETTLEQECFVSLTAYDSTAAQETADDTYVAAIEGNQNILGKIGGNAIWIQGDETPACDCGNQMRFVALLEERGGGGINFGGGGIGYVFACNSCNDKAKFLWQS